MSRKSAIGLALAAAAAAVVAFVPTSGLSPAAHRLGAIWAAVVVLWITEALPLPVTALLAPTAAVLLRVAPARDAYGPFADPVIFLLIGSFFLARAFELSGLGRRLALTLLTLPGIAGRPMRILPAFGAVCFTISMWTSNTATTALMFPIGLSLLAAIEPSGNATPAAGPVRGRYASCLLLLCAFGASIGGLATPVGTPPNLIGLGILERTVGSRPTFLEWMAVGTPLALVLFGFMSLVFLLAVRSDPASRPHPTPRLLAERRALGPPSAHELAVAGVFGLTVLLWVLPGVVALVLGSEAPASRALAAALPESAAALVGAGLLFAIPAGGRPTLTWEEARDIDWGTIVLFGGGICLGGLLLSTGLAEGLARALRAAAGITSPLGIVALVTGLAIFLSETSSNTAAATLIVPVAVALARAASLDPVVPALAATAGSSLGFMLPVSTPPNAIVFGSGRIRLLDMVRYGILLDLAGFAAIVGAAHILMHAH